MILLYLDRLNWREGNPECQEEPESYFKKIYYDTAGPIRAAFIKLVYDTVAPDRFYSAPIIRTAGAAATISSIQ